MPAYNQAQYIEEAVDSVIEQVDRLIIVDDGSTDETLDRAYDCICGEWADRHADVLCSFQNEGTAAAINRGFSEAVNGLCDLPNLEWITWVSSDNVYEPNWMSTLLGAVRPDVGVVYSAYWHGSKSRPFFKPYDPARLVNDQNCYFGPSFIIRRDVWQETGLHRGKISHDYDHWLRVEETCWAKGLQIIGLPQPLCFYRVHPERVTVTRRHQYDADHWQEVARERRARLGICPPAGALRMSPDAP